MTTEDELDEYALRLAERLRNLVDSTDLRYEKRLAEKGDERDQRRYLRKKWDYRTARNLRARTGEQE